MDLKNSLMLHEAGKAVHKSGIVIQILIFIAVFLVSNIVAGIILGVIMTVTAFAGLDVAAFLQASLDNPLEAASMVMAEMPDWTVLAPLFLTAITTVFAIIYCVKIEKRSMVSMGLMKSRFSWKYLRGFLVGTLMICATLGLAVALGGARFTGPIPDFSLGMVLLFFLGFLIQGMSEEVLVRGYFMMSCANRVKPALAVAISSVAFAALHLANSGISLLAFVNLTLFGAFAGVYVLRTDDLWGACAIHSAWNFIQGNVLGISVSGGAAMESVFGTAFVEGRELISGGAFGIEGGVCTTIVLTAALLLTVYLPQKPRPELAEEESGTLPESPDGFRQVYKSS